MSGGFSFNPPGGTPGQLNLGTPTAPPPSLGGFSFNSTTAAAPATTTAGTAAFSFNAAKPNTSGSGGFSFGTALGGATIAPSMGTGGLNFSAPASGGTSTLASALTAGTPASASLSAGFSFGLSQGQPTVPSSSVPPQQSTAPPAFSFNPGQTSSLFTPPTTTPVPVAPKLSTPAFNLVTPVATSIPTAISTSSGLGGLLGAKLSAPVAQQPVSGFSGFGTTATVAAAPIPAAIISSGLTKPTLTTPVPGVAPASSAPAPTLPSFGGLLAPKTPTPAATPSTGGFSFTAPPASSSATPAALTTSTIVSSTAATPSLSVRMLEERQNKWLLELQEQEERFLQQAVHINSWDQVLQQGHDQVQSLKDNLQGVKSDQSRLEAELDFIKGQQEELEQILEPLEAAVTSNTTSHHQGDRQRDNMYHLAQNLDGQLRQMTDDLCKVIEHLNGNSTTAPTSDPVSMVARILSAHMDTLKWVEQNSVLLNQKVDELSRTSDTIM